jgi:hypothetical protein
MKKLFYLILLNLFLSQVMFSQNALWFKDITIEAGLQGLKTTYIQSADINGDNYPDILVGTSGIITGHSNTFYLYLNVPDETSPNKRKFVDYTQESGLNVSRIPGKPTREYDIAIIGDVDNDGDLDVVTTMYYHRLEYVTNPDILDKSEVFLNDGTGHFTIKEDAGLADHVFFKDFTPGLVDGVGLAFLDYDYDGILDLYIATKFKDYARNITFPDILMKGNGDGSFREVTDAGVQDIVEPLYGVNVTDFDNDGWQDVITSPYCRTGGRIMKNLGDGSFIDVAQNVNYSAQNYGGDWYYNNDYSQWMQQPLCQWEAPVADFDNDGDMDILQCLIHGGYESRDGVREGHTHIAINQGPPDYNFIDDLDRIHRKANPATHLGDYGGLWVDFENNGWLDLVICQGYYYPSTDRAYLCIQREDNQFYDVTQELGLMYLKDASNAQACDFDLDGDMDIFIFHNSTDGSKLRLLRNDISNESNWVSIKLVSPAGSNKDAVGARIRLYTDTIAQIREIQTGLGHFGGQEPFIQNFGFGKINGIDSIEVRWPMKGNPVTKVYNPAWNTHLVIDSEGFKEYLDLWNEPVAMTKFFPSRTNMGTINVGETETAEIKIINSGSEILKVKSLQIDNPVNFTVKNIVGPFTLNPADSMTVQIEFTPSLREIYRTKLIVETGSNQSDTAANGRFIAHDIIGNGYKQEALIAVDNKAINYDSTKTFQDKILKISNQGELDLVISSIEINNDSNNVFEIIELTNSNLLPYTIKAGNEWNLTVRFSPKARRNYSGDILIKSNAYKDTNFVVSLTGVGDAPTALTKYDNVFLNFPGTPVGEYSDFLINVKNIGDGDLNIINASIEDNEDNIYSFFGMEFPIIVEPGASRDITLRFEPKEQISYNRKVHIYSNSQNEPDKVMNARAKGIEPAFVEQKVSNEDMSIIIKPNPVIDKLELEINPKVLIGNIDVRIYDINGKLLDIIYNDIYPINNIIRYDVENLSTGTYLIIINYGEKQISVLITKIK